MDVGLVVLVLKSPFTKPTIAFFLSSCCAKNYDAHEIKTAYQKILMKTNNVKCQNEPATKLLTSLIISFNFSMIGLKKVTCLIPI